MEERESLTVYRASAGSGKTFTLAVEYIKLLILDPSSYRRILAVTFTNKATAEMKERILSQLHGIANGLKSSEAYVAVIQEKLRKEQGKDFTKEYIALQAKKALTNLLHNYNYFRVETIDTFFQSILRGLSRELNLSANMQIDINEKDILKESVSELISKLDRNNLSDRATFDWILDIIRQKIDNGKNWQVEDELVSFGENITKAYYLDNEEKIREAIESGEVKRLKEQLSNEEKQAKDFVATATDHYMQAIKQANIDGATFKNGIHNFFVNVQKGQTKEAVKAVIAAQESEENWIAKSKKGEERNFLLNVIKENSLCEVIKDIRTQNKILRNTEVNLRYLDRLQMIDKIDESVRTRNKEANRFLLAETPGLLNKLIQKSDAPFIYEKTGSTIEHIMIDEFQDTSTTQWNNFRILLDEAIANAHSCLIVGDVKQSIYRWRDGDWTILNNIDNTYPINAEKLDTNRRSYRNVIEFNNSFFDAVLNMPKAKVTEEDDKRIRSAYSDVEQLVPEGKKQEGYVSLQLLPQEQGEMTGAELKLYYLLEETRRLMKEGVKASDICFLVRKNRQASLIADYFAAEAPEINIVSNEAFRLRSSKTVSNIISALKMLNNPDDQLSEIMLGNVIPQEILTEIKRLPLLEQVEALYRHLCPQNSDHSEDAYIMSFIDEVQRYMNERSADLNGFIELWDTSLCEKCIPSAKSDGIRIMTVHTAKGLEFHTVVIPFADDVMPTSEPSHGDQIMWCKPAENLKTTLPIIPVRYDSNMAEAGYEKQYNEESMQKYVDNLNTLYVALTRPKANLIIQAMNKKVTRSTSTAAPTVFQTYYEQVKDAPDGNVLENYEYGKLVPSEENKKEEATDNALLVKGNEMMTNMVSTENLIEFRQSNASADFINGENEEKSKEFINKGLLMHKIFSMIETTADIDRVIGEMTTEGIIATEKEAKQIRRLIENGLKNDMVTDWFSGRYKLYNECDIIFRQRKKLHHRPDRVMMDAEKKMTVVDFKFGTMKESYKAQVKEYIDLLKLMGYNEVKGYIWLVYQNKIEAVEA